MLLWGVAMVGPVVLLHLSALNVLPDFTGSRGELQSTSRCGPFYLLDLSYIHNIPSRREVALGCIRGRTVPRRELLSFMVRLSHLLNHTLD